ncbi:MAG TPA: HD domain-containing phosphohydrolase [Candidatus Dormibacteraeota bacterium]|nr:HD domain-containing phosphohydrolase [Candidatus Dormibacteraeota bacterium]
MQDTNRKRRVLVIDDDELLCELIRTTFELEGFEVATARDVIEAERALAKSRPDAILLDIGLPGIDGVFYLERLRETPHTSRIPIVAISGSEEAGRAASAAGAEAFLRKPFSPLELLGLVAPLVKQAVPDADEGSGTVDIADLNRLIEIGRRQHELLTEAYAQTVAVLASALESRDFGTSRHSRRVTSYATRLTLEVAPSLLDDPSLEWGFMLHDVGKIGVPDEILLKPGALTARERRRMEKHAVIGEQLLSHIPLLNQEGARVIRSHHERWDGNGYPDRLSGESIPLGARIFAVVDALDAMTDTRPYRQPVGWDEAVEEIRRCSGGQFDPDLIYGFEACEPDLHRLHTEALAAA